MSLLNLFALLLCGYSLFCAAAIAVTHFGAEAYRHQAQARAMGCLLLAALAGLQAAHAAELALGTAATQHPLYQIALFTVAPAFYLFSAPLLGAGQAKGPAGWRFWHAVSALLAPACPPGLARPLAFLIGAGYLVWLGWRLYGLRQVRERFPAEMLLLGTALAIAAAMAVSALLPGLLPPAVFTPLYACAIGLALLLVQVTLGLRPQLGAEVQAEAQARYQSSTLAHVDVEAALVRLAQLMGQERVFADPDLSLASLAGMLGVSGHQLSELLNNRLGKSFARVVRERRVEAAKELLCRQPGTSVLSVGMSVGFTSQSNFYEAFREIEGSTPGQYRKLNLKRPATPATPAETRSGACLPPE